MRNSAILKGIFLPLIFSISLLFPAILWAQKGLIAAKIEALKLNAGFDDKINLFSVASDQLQENKISALLTSSRLLELGSTASILR